MNEIDHNDEIQRRLERARPLPRPAFRGELRRHLAAEARPTPPPRLLRLVTAYIASGTAVLAVVAVGLAGAGPLAT